MKKLKSKQQGFTIVEWVIVMVVIGILSAVALPRMVNLAKEARKSAHLAVINNLDTSIELLRNQWMAMSEPDVVQTADGVNIFMRHDIGFPLNVGESQLNPLPTDECINLWNALLKNPPLASAETGCAANGTCKYELYVSDLELDLVECQFINKDNDHIEFSYYVAPNDVPNHYKNITMVLDGEYTQYDF